MPEILEFIGVIVGGILYLGFVMYGLDRKGYSPAWVFLGPVALIILFLAPQRERPWSAPSSP